MLITKKYSFKNGEQFIKKNHPEELEEVMQAIENVNAADCLSKISEEKTMRGKLLFSPVDFNKAIKCQLCELDWTEKTKTKKGFREPRIYFEGNRFREMDGIKNGVGLEIQFGKYAFMGYDIFSKMVIFKNKGKIDCGIEVVATEEIVGKMSTGVSGFEQIIIDFENRGEANIDIPVLVLGIGLTEKEREESSSKAKKYKNSSKETAMKRNTLFEKYNARPGPK